MNIAAEYEQSTATQDSDEKATVLNKEDLKRRAGLFPYQRRLQLHKSGEGYKALCCFHRDRNPSLSIFERDGVWLFKCWVCTKQGDIIQFVMERDRVQFQEAMKIIGAECGLLPPDVRPEQNAFEYDRREATDSLLADGEAQEYLIGRGITLDAVFHSGIGLVRYPGIGKALSIPYETGDVKFRALNPMGKGRRFRATGKPNNKLYGIEKIPADPNDPNDWTLAEHALIVESELDCITARQLLDQDTWVVVSVPSASACVGGDGDLRIDPAHLARLKNFNGKFFVATDQDEAGERCANALIKALPKGTAFRVSWDGAKDVGELYQKFKDDFRVELERLCQKSLIPLLWREAMPFDKMPVKEYEWLIAGLIPKEEVTLLNGDFGSLKSYVCLFLADAISGGGKFAGRQCQQQSVLFLDRENSHQSLSSRRLKVGGLQYRNNVRILGLFTPHRAPDFTSPELLKVCAKIKPVIIVDSLVDFHPGKNENSPDDMALVFLHLRELISAGATAVIVLHHVPKSGEGQGGKYRGSTAIPAGGTVALLVKKENEKDGEVDLTISGFKVRDGSKEDAKVTLRFRFDDAVTYEVLQESQDSDVILQNKVLAYVGDHDCCSASAVADAVRGKRTRIQAAMDALKSRKLLFVSGGRGRKGLLLSTKPQHTNNE
jgi:hypothetical protein